tara:strand:- start:853 stop:1647 length:795 start_codon:yes stop_codon:yes gene_type:complete
MIYFPENKIMKPFNDLLFPKPKFFMPQRARMGAAGIAVGGGDETSYAFDGTTDWLDVADHGDWDFGASAFCLEMRFKSSSATNQYLFTRSPQGNRPYVLQVNATTGDIRFSGNDFGAWDFTTTEFNVTDGNWHHIAGVSTGVAGATQKVYVDGVASATSATSSASLIADAGELRMGSRHDGGAGHVNGNMDEIRVSNVARYTTNFTPSTRQFNSDANTLLLIHCGEDIVTGTTGSGATFTDSGNTGHTVTENGNAIEDTTTYKF